jgi:hypothetical protein
MQKLRIVTSGISGGRSLTGPLRDARRFPSTRWYPVPRATRTTVGFGICPSLGPFSVAPCQTLAKVSQLPLAGFARARDRPNEPMQSHDSQLFHRFRTCGHFGCCAGNDGLAVKVMFLELDGSKKQQDEAGLRPDLGHLSTGLASRSLPTQRVDLYFDVDGAGRGPRSASESVRAHCPELLKGLKHIFEKEYTHHHATGSKVCAFSPFQGENAEFIGSLAENGQTCGRFCLLAVGVACSLARIEVRRRVPHTAYGRWEECRLLPGECVCATWLWRNERCGSGSHSF